MLEKCKWSEQSRKQSRSFHRAAISFDENRQNLKRLVFILKLFPASAKHSDTKQMKLSSCSEINWSFIVNYFVNLIRHRERKSFSDFSFFSWSFKDISDIRSEIRTWFLYLRLLFIPAVSHSMIRTRFRLFKIHDELRRFQ